MQVVSDETPLFMRWHYLNAYGFHPIRSKVSPLVIDMYDGVFAKHGMKFCHLLAFAIYSLKHQSKQNSQFVINRQVPVDFPMPTGKPLDILKKLKKQVLRIPDQAIPKFKESNIILLGMAGTRRLVEMMYAVPNKSKVLIGRYALGPHINTRNTRIRGETGYERSYFAALEDLKKRCDVEAFTLNPRYFQADKTSHAVTRRSMLKSYGEHTHLIQASKYEDEPYNSSRVYCDNATKNLLSQVHNGTYMNDLKLAWIANHWEDSVTTLRSTFQIKDCFLERCYSLDCGNHIIPDQLKHIGDLTVNDRMLVYPDRALTIDSLFKTALQKGISELKITACTINPGPSNVSRGMHGGDPFVFQDIDDMLALNAMRDIVKCTNKI